MPDRRWLDVAVPAVVIALVAALIAFAGVVGNNPEPRGEPANFTISYAGAAQRLDGMAEGDKQEQLRDWARTGLATHLGLAASDFRDASFDTLPVRDAGFAELARQPVGPGRALATGDGVLHLLVPRGDPDRPRIIGLLLDQYTADAGADPGSVRVHSYEIRPRTQTIEVTADGPPVPVADVRAANGFVEMRVDDVAGLTAFLAATRHLSWLQVRGTEIWAGGWNWRRDQLIDFEDVSAIQRGYEPDTTASDADESGSTAPGFSLDPGPLETMEDLSAVLPGLSAELAVSILADDWEGSPFGSRDGFADALDEALFDGAEPEVLRELGLPADPLQLWALTELLGYQPIYSEARYDGNLAGTEVGMTLFYTDYVAKDWAGGVGTGVPTDAVEGFVPDTEADIPWSHCTSAEDEGGETGRLWFGQSESAFAFGPDQVRIGAQATRLFARSDAEDGQGGEEVESSFAFGRGLRWWDQHYRAIADYEPQYERLEQIMRWSGAIEWLTATTSTYLPRLDDAEIRSDLRFAAWYEEHDELRERAPIAFVAPPSASEEALLTTPTNPFNHCGVPFMTGGVSLGDLVERRGDRSLRADLPPHVDRAGPVNESSSYNERTGEGHIKQLSVTEKGEVVDGVEWTLTRPAADTATVDIVAPGRRVEPFGGLKIWRANTADQQLRFEVSTGRGGLTQRVDLQGHRLGELVATAAGTGNVIVQWRPGMLDRARRVLDAIQNRLFENPGSEPLPQGDEALYSFRSDDGTVMHRIGGGDDPWLSITEELLEPGESLAFRLGAPAPSTGAPRFFFGTLVPEPPIGGTGQWIEVKPPGRGPPPSDPPPPGNNGDEQTWISAAEAPRDDDPTIAVTTPDGETATVHRSGDRLLVPADDPILGLAGTPEGAAVMRNVAEVSDAMSAAAQADDELLRAIPLGGDGAALAGPDKVIVAGADHPWTARVQSAIGPDPSGEPPLMRIAGGHLLHVDSAKLTVADPPARRMTLEEVLGSGDAVYLHESLRATLGLTDGPIIGNTLPRTLGVRVQEAWLAQADSVSQERVGEPDVRVHADAEWMRVDGGVPRSYINSTPTSSPGPVSGPLPVAPSTTTSAGISSTATPLAGSAASSGRILLVCPDSDRPLAGCG